jgi:hypothetical protein
MLPLDSPRWQTMRQCGGYSTVVPSLHGRLESPASFMDERGAFDSLRLAVIRCGEVDDVSYAAAPHLARLSKISGLPPWEYLGLLAEVEARRACGLGPPVPEDLAPAYLESVQELPRLVSERASAGLGTEAVATLAGALTVALGQPRLGMAIMELGSELRHRDGKVECPACGQEYQPSGYSFWGAGPAEPLDSLRSQGTKSP